MTLDHSISTGFFLYCSGRLRRLFQKEIFEQTNYGCIKFNHQFFVV
jgi:hypothetical protein